MGTTINRAMSTSLARPKPAVKEDRPQKKTYPNQGINNHLLMERGASVTTGSRNTGENAKNRPMAKVNSQIKPFNGRKILMPSEIRNKKSIFSNVICNEIITMPSKDNLLIKLADKLFPSL